MTRVLFIFLLKFPIFAIIGIYSPLDKSHLARHVVRQGTARCFAELFRIEICRAIVSAAMLFALCELGLSAIIS